MFDVQDSQQTTAGTAASAAGYLAFSGQPVHILDRLAALFRHRRIAGAAFAIVVSLMMLQSYSKIPQYRASARVMIQDQRANAAGTAGGNEAAAAQDLDQYYNTQYSILRSRGVATRVVRRLNLHDNPLFN